jgi:ATP-binding protein involved in chromosome partitioning
LGRDPWHDASDALSIDSMQVTPRPTIEQVQTALATVNDPEIKRPVTELGMVKDVSIEADGVVAVEILLTVASCPLQDTLTRDVDAAVGAVSGVSRVEVSLGVMTDEQRQGLRTHLKGSGTSRDIPFAKAGSLTRVFAIASGKGGVGKSSVTVNLAVAMVGQGLSVGVVDADVYGHSVPDMFGIGDRRPTQIEDMIMPVDSHGVRVMSIGMLKPRRDQVVAWRGPMLDRALVQMLADVYWGDLDVLLLDLPPGTGDVAISLGQRLANAAVVVVTTPQQAAAGVAERAGTMASMMKQRVVGVVENMSFLSCPHCGPQHRIEVFGAGGGKRVASALGERFGYEVPFLGGVPMDPQVRAGGDSGIPLVLSDPAAPAAQALTTVARSLTGRGRGLAGLQLGLTPVGR